MTRQRRNVLMVVLVLGCLYTAYRLTLHCLVEARLDEIRKQGYPATLAELDQWYPEPPATQNAGSHYLEAFGHYVSSKSDTNLPIHWSIL